MAESLRQLIDPGTAPAVVERKDAADPSTMHEKVYRTMHEALIVGRFTPGKGISLRSLAAALNVGVMPVREAIRRLAAEHALEVRDNRRVYVPSMTRPRFEELMRARMLLEPECALRALPRIDTKRLAMIRAHDQAMNDSYATGNAELYMAANYRFHFGIYDAAGSEVMVPLLESLWVRFGPFLRMVYGIVGTAELTDKHELAIDAIRRGDGAALKAAIEADIADGMHLLGSTMFKA
jgi:DNA-binding GntR family transcriptional regulator